jgi:hypothetical protein
MMFRQKDFSLSIVLNPQLSRRLERANRQRARSDPRFLCDALGLVAVIHHLTDLPPTRDHRHIYVRRRIPSRRRPTTLYEVPAWNSFSRRWTMKMNTPLMEPETDLAAEADFSQREAGGASKLAGALLRDVAGCVNGLPANSRTRACQTRVRGRCASRLQPPRVWDRTPAYGSSWLVKT